MAGILRRIILEDRPSQSDICLLPLPLLGEFDNQLIDNGLNAQRLHRNEKRAR